MQPSADALLTQSNVTTLTAPLAVQDWPLGRRAECDRLDDVIAVVCAGQSSTLVIRGEAGIGKTVLLDYVVEHVMTSSRVLRASGVESEMELPFAGLHQLCMPILERSSLLPEPQRDAIQAAFGLRSGGPADRLMVALASLNLLSSAAEDEPLFCIIDDTQWLDQASMQTLLFIARRLLADRIGLIFAIRTDSNAFAGLPELEVKGLRDRDALQLLSSVVDGRLDPRVSQRILAETHGNPLAITQLPRGLTAIELGAGLGPSAGLPLSGQIEKSFQRRYAQLPAETRSLLLLAAAEPLGDPALLWRAATVAGLPGHLLTSADTGGLMTIGLLVQFQHPLARSAIYSAATGLERQAAHRAIAEAIDPGTEPDHYAWHRSQAATGADEKVADELERASSRALARGGLAASAAILERATQLSTSRPEIVRRGLAAARATYAAGSPDRALELIAVLESGPLGPMERATITRLQGQIAVSLGQPHRATGLLLEAAIALSASDPAAARETFLETLEAATYAGRFGPTGGPGAVAAEILRLAPAGPAEPGLVDHLLDGMLTWAIDGLPPAMPILRRALVELSSSAADPVASARWIWLAYHIVTSSWEDDYWLAMTERYRASVRNTGALSLLPCALLGSACFALWTGDFATADTLLEDSLGISTAIGLPPTASGSRAALTAWRGQHGATEAIVGRIVSDGTAGDERYRITFAHYCMAVLNNGLGDYTAAFNAARASAFEQQLGFPELLLPELIESAVRLGERAEAEKALERLIVRTGASATSWALGIESYCRALLANGDEAEAFYRQAIMHLDSCRIVPFRHRARLVYGEWLRRERRRIDARDQLHTAYQAFTAMGANGFAERARRELLATGGTVARRTEESRDALTPQELQVAQLASADASNQEIAAQLFISPSTVGYHLSKAFRKLDINSRRQLTHALSALENSGRR